MLFNVAVAQCRLGLWTEATSSLLEAISKGTVAARAGLDAALDQVQVRGAGEMRCPESLQFGAHIYVQYEMELAEGSCSCAQE